ncbi:hypothetical protein [Amycolatopsis solani]|uniref:hypothetical protein n=1 Tax=Amycolatopsis solani TaxID=3028615 RepID=UPI0025B1A526|nr:hypothetical protein [Amycolatopsis sp. MEP2-6]
MGEGFAGLEGAVRSITAGAFDLPLTITRPEPVATLGTFAGEWGGHTRSLTITADGRATEHVDDRVMKSSTRHQSGSWPVE